MSDLKKYVEKRKARDPVFAENYEAGYLEFKIGVLIPIDLHPLEDMENEDLKNSIANSEK